MSKKKYVYILMEQEEYGVTNPLYPGEYSIKIVHGAFGSSDRAVQALDAWIKATGAIVDNQKPEEIVKMATVYDRELFTSTTLYILKKEVL